jgi:hypothetical protein
VFGDAYLSIGCVGSGVSCVYLEHVLTWRFGSIIPAECHECEVGRRVEYRRET